MAKKPPRGNAPASDPALIPGIVKGDAIPQPAPKRIVPLVSATSRLAEYNIAPPDAAAMIGIGESTLRKRADAGEIPHIRSGTGQKRKYWFRRIDLERYVENSVEVVGETSAIPVDAIEASDLQTNPAIEQVHADRPSLFRGWTNADWQELYSQHGAGGPLTADGVTAAADEINRLRDVRNKFEAVIRGEHGKALAVMIDGFYADQSAKQKQRR